MCSACLGASRASWEQGVGREEGTEHPADKGVSKGQRRKSLWAPGKGKVEWRADVVMRRGAPRNLQRTWHIWKAGSWEKGGGMPSSFRE